MAAGNVEAARLFMSVPHRRTWAQGVHAPAATFDPDGLTSCQTISGLRPDPTAGKRWHERARERDVWRFEWR